MRDFSLEFHANPSSELSLQARLRPYITRASSDNEIKFILDQIHWSLSKILLETRIKNGFTGTLSEHENKIFFASNSLGTCQKYHSKYELSHFSLRLRVKFLVNSGAFGTSKNLILFLLEARVKS